MTLIETGVAPENASFATPTELRQMAEVAEHLNEAKESLTLAGNELTFDDIAVYDGAGTKIAVLSWRLEADSFGLQLGG